MYKTLRSLMKSWVKALVAIGLVVALSFGHADGALAAGGGRIGGGSFRAPSRTYSAPRNYAPGGGYRGGYGGGYGGGGFGLPFLFPVLGIGGGAGGLFSILIFLAVANFLVQSFRRSRSDDSLGDSMDSSTISVAKLQVGLLAEARELQADLNTIAQKADTSSTNGLAEVLQEATLALLRHPEYWVYAGATVQQTRLEAAESQFNRLLIAERSKFSGETLSNVNSQLKQASTSSLVVAEKACALANQAAGPGEYIVVTLLVGSQGKLQLPKVNSSDDLRQALQQLGGVSSERLLALEVLWTPQAEGDVLTNEDVIVQYPDLKLV